MAVEKTFGGCTSLGCLTTTIPPIDNNCKNPLIHLLYEVVGLTAPGLGTSVGGGPDTARKSTVGDVLDRILDKGIYIQGECELCCPDCNNLYFLGSVESSMKVLFGNYQVDSNGDCNTNGITLYGCPPVNQSVDFCGVYNPDCGISSCCNGFQEGFDGLICLAEQTTVVNGFNSSLAEVFDRIMDKGVVEYGTINGESQIKHFVEWLSQVPYWTDLASASYAEVIDRILDKGVVVWCDPDTGTYLISSIETFFKSLRCEDGSIIYDGPGGSCCLNIKASVETYGKYLSSKACHDENGCGAVPA
jgi:hypothetical protein